MTAVVGGSIPQAKSEPTECLFENRKICASPNETNIMRQYLEAVSGRENRALKDNNDREIVILMKKELGVDTESAIWENRKFKEFVGESKARQVLKKLYKPPGPSDSTELLDNFNIDNTLSQWSANSKTLFNKKFYHIPFQMIDFEKVRSELSRVTLADIINRGYDCFGVVLNTDVSSGRGKHWFCIYGDFAHAGTKEDPYTLEYFNSSGRPMIDDLEVIEIWMQKAIHELKRDTGKECVIVRSMNKRIQYSNTECGVFSLMYIKSRLQGHPSNWFYTVHADDEDMILLRRHLFRKGKEY